MSLYELSVETKKIEARFDALDADVSPEQGLEILKQIEDVALDTDEKFIGAYHYLANLEAEIEAIDAEIKRLQARKKARQNRISSFRGYVLYCLQILNVPNKKTAICTFTRTKPKESVEVDTSQVWQWPADVAAKVSKVVYEVNKNDLKKVPNYKELPGVKVCIGEESLQIR